LDFRLIQVAKLFGLSRRFVEIARASSHRLLGSVSVLILGDSPDILFLGRPRRKGGPGFSLQVLARVAGCGLSAAIPGANSVFKKCLS